MAKINHLEMGADVLALQDVQVKKGFMGLTVKLIYQPTNSVIKIKEKEYSTEDGRKLENILRAAHFFHVSEESCVAHLGGSNHVVCQFAALYHHAGTDAHYLVSVNKISLDRKSVA